MDEPIMELQDVYSNLARNIPFLYHLLAERDIGMVSISHRVMPSPTAHREFVELRPYKDWWIIYIIVGNNRVPVGAVYLSKNDEIGIQIIKSHQRRGYGERAVRLMMQMHPETLRFLANVNPRNGASLELFRKLGFARLQLTLKYNASKGEENDT